MKNFKVYEDSEEGGGGGMVLAGKKGGVGGRLPLKEIDVNVRKRTGGERGKEEVRVGAVMKRRKEYGGEEVKRVVGEELKSGVWLHYERDVFDYLKSIERRLWPKPGFMTRQPELVPKARSTLVDWLTEVTHELQLGDEVLWAAAIYCDRFLGRFSVVKSKYQLLGITAVFIAAKYEEVTYPHLRGLTEMTDNTYTEEQVLAMECLLLKGLNFEMGPPSPLLFLHLLEQSPPSLHLASYILELGLVAGGPFFSFPPSLLASASLALARYTLGLSPWPDHLASTSGHSPYDLAPVVPLLNSQHRVVDQHLQATRNKYLSDTYMGVANVPHIDLEEDYLLHLQSLSLQVFG